MTQTQRTGILAGIVAGAVVAGLLVWFLRGPSEATVRRTVVTTIQEEAPASVMVTGKLQIATTIDVDSTSTMTPEWATTMLRLTHPELIGFTTGTASVRLRIPGTVSYGFDVRDLTPAMITVEEGIVAVELPPLSVQAVEPDLTKLEVQTSTSGWMKMFTGEMEEEVRKNALARVQETLRSQAEARLASSTQPRINTARALRAMLRPPLQAAGLGDPQFRFRIGDDLVLTPSGPPESRPTPQKPPSGNAGATGDSSPHEAPTETSSP